MRAPRATVRHIAKGPMFEAARRRPGTAKERAEWLLDELESITGFRYVGEERDRLVKALVPLMEG